MQWFFFFNINVYSPLVHHTGIDRLIKRMLQQLPTDHCVQYWLEHITTTQTSLFQSAKHFILLWSHKKVTFQEWIMQEPFLWHVFMRLPMPVKACLHGSRKCCFSMWSYMNKVLWTWKQTLHSTGKIFLPFYSVAPPLRWLMIFMDSSLNSDEATRHKAKNHSFWLGKTV